MLEEGGLLAAQRNAAILLQQTKALMSLIDKTQAVKLDATFQALLEEAASYGSDFALKAIQAIDSTNPVFKPQIPIEAVRYAAEDALDRLRTHSETFAKRASTIVAQGLIQGWGINKTAQLMTAQLAIVKTNATTIVRTETMQALSKATMATYAENKIGFVMRHTAIGERVCAICAARSGEITRAETTIAILHPRCRDYLTPVKPEWLRLGLINLDWAKNFHEQTLKALPEEVVPKYGQLAPFEKSLGLEKPTKPVWSPKSGFLDSNFAKAAGA